jgi:hypothetical protein
MGWIFAYVVFEIKYFPAISWTDCHPSRSITSFLQRCDLRNVLLQEDNPLICPFYPKIFYNATFTLMNDSRNNVFIYGSLWVFFWCLHKILLLLTAPPFFKKIRHFLSYDDLAMIHSNPDNSAISKLWYFKFYRCDVETLVNIIM